MQNIKKNQNPSKDQTFGMFGLRTWALVSVVQRKGFRALRLLTKLDRKEKQYRLRHVNKGKQTGYKLKSTQWQ